MSHALQANNLMCDVFTSQGIPRIGLKEYDEKKKDILLGDL